MAAIDFPDSPTEGDTHTVGEKTWKYTNGAWVIVPYSGAFSVNIDGGNASSVYGGIDPLDGGGP
jgi:hypothetical protein